MNETEQEATPATFGNLTGAGGTHLICPSGGEDHGLWSADPGDYWMVDDDFMFTCDECGTPQIEVRRISTYQPML